MQGITARLVPQRRNDAKPRAIVHEKGNPTALVCEREGGVWVALHGLAGGKRMPLPTSLRQGLRVEVKEALDALDTDREA